MKTLLSSLAMLTLLVSCASKKDDKELVEREHENIKREYVVTNSSSDIRPGWIEDAEVWARQHSLDTNKYRYFRFCRPSKWQNDVTF